MGVIGRAKQLVFGGGASGEQTDEDREPTHVCESCGEEYYAASDQVEISECRACGGVKVSSA